MEMLDVLEHLLPHLEPRSWLALRATSAWHYAALSAPRCRAVLARVVPEAAHCPPWPGRRFCGLLLSWIRAGAPYPETEFAMPFVPSVVGGRDGEEREDAEEDDKAGKGGEDEDAGKEGEDDEAGNAQVSAGDSVACARALLSEFRNAAHYYKCAAARPDLGLRYVPCVPWFRVWAWLAGAGKGQARLGSALPYDDIARTVARAWSAAALINAHASDSFRCDAALAAAVRAGVPLSDEEKALALCFGFSATAAELRAGGEPFRLTAESVSKLQVVWRELAKSVRAKGDADFAREFGARVAEIRG